MYQIKKAKAEQTYLLRQQILRPHQTITELNYPGDQQANSRHFICEDGSETIGIVSVYKQANPDLSALNQWRIRGMAVLPQYQKKGVGRSLLKTVIEYVQQQQGDLTWCNARENASLFYQSLSFEIVGEPFDIIGIGCHYLMVCHMDGIK